LVSIARDITGLDLHSPDFLQFNKIKIYVCPAQTTIGTTKFQEGFSLLAEMTIFGKHVDAFVSVSEGVNIHGSTDELNIGPLVIRGWGQNNQATIALDVGESGLSGHFEGLMVFLDLTIGLQVRFEAFPDPSFQFEFMLNFTELLLFKVQASFVGTTEDLHHPSRIEFSLYACFEQHILRYIEEQLSAQISHAQLKGKDEILQAKQKVANEREKHTGLVKAAESVLAEARTSWERHRMMVLDEIERRTREYDAGLMEHRRDLEMEQRKFLDLQSKAQARLRRAKAEREARLRKACADLEKKRAEWETIASAARRELVERKRRKDLFFGFVEHALATEVARAYYCDAEIVRLREQISQCRNTFFGILYASSLPQSGWGIHLRLDLKLWGANF
jgi:hypothetical protein